MQRLLFPKRCSFFQPYQLTLSDNKTGIIRLIAYYPFQIAKKLVLLPSSSRRDGWMDGRWNLKKKQKRDGDQLADRGRNRLRRCGFSGEGDNVLTPPSC